MLIEMKDVIISYPQTGTVLNKIDLNVEKGSLVGITGKAGCGKTTLLETIACFHKPESGNVLFEGNNIYEKKYDGVYFRRKLQVVFQFSENQFFETDVLKEISFGLEMLNIPEEISKQRIDDALNSVGLNGKDILNLSPFALSGGQKRRLALACSLVLRPEVLLLDEPFTGLDADGQKCMIETLKKEHEKGMTVIMVSHDPDILCEIADRIIVLHDGKIVSDGSPVNVFSNENDCIRYGIGLPDTKKAADMIGLGSLPDLSYDTFLKTLQKRISGDDK